MNKAGPFVTLTTVDGTHKIPASAVPQGIVCVSTPKQPPQQHPGDVVITKIGNQGYGMVGLAPPQNPLAEPTVHIRESAEPTADIRENEKSVMKKRVVSVESEESSEGSGFQVIPSPLTTVIETKYQQLLTDGKQSEEALAILMSQVKPAEMPIFLEWIHSRMPQLQAPI